MIWHRNGPEGMISEPFRVGRFTVDEGALCTLYGLWHNDDHLGYFESFKDAQEAAEKHAKGVK